MTKAVLVVFTNVTSPEHDDAFNDWYDDTHLADVLAVPGFVAASRYRISAVQAPGVEPPHRYMAVYEIDNDDLPGALKALGRAGRDIVISEHLDPATQMAYLYEEITPRVAAVEAL